VSVVVSVCVVLWWCCYGLLFVVFLMVWLIMCCSWCFGLCVLFVLGWF
jgi:hypothetical protein